MILNCTMEINRKEIGGRIKKALVEAKLSQRDLSKALGVTEPSVTAYIQGESNLPAKAYAIVSDLCGVTIDWLITGKNEPAKPSIIAEKHEMYESIGLGQEDRRISILKSEMEEAYGEKKTDQERLEFMSELLKFLAERKN
jgi:transcriptional regulator with XRE-family HTH domain